MTRADYRTIAYAFHQCKPTYDQFRYTVWQNTMNSVGEALKKADPSLPLEWWMDCCFHGQQWDMKNSPKNPPK